MTSTSTATPARLRSRRVHASCEVRPRTESPIGPKATITTGAAAARPTPTDATVPTTASAAPVPLTGVAVHHRSAKRVVDPGR